jgi:hypothetical protein
MSALFSEINIQSKTLSEYCNILYSLYYRKKYELRLNGQSYAKCNVDGLELEVFADKCIRIELANNNELEERIYGYEPFWKKIQIFYDPCPATERMPQCLCSKVWRNLELEDHERREQKWKNFTIEMKLDEINQLLEECREHSSLFLRIEHQHEMPKTIDFCYLKSLKVITG